MVTIDRRTLLAGLVLAPAAGLLSSGTAAAKPAAVPNGVQAAADDVNLAVKYDLFWTDGGGIIENAWKVGGYDTAGAAVDTEWSGVHDDWARLDDWVKFPGTWDVWHIAAVSRNPNQIDLFFTDQHGRVRTAWWTEGATWSSFNGFRDIGGSFPAGAVVTAISQDANSLDLFVIGNDGCVYTSWWRVPNDWSGLNDNWRNLGGGNFGPGRAVTAICGVDGMDLFTEGT